LEINFARGYLNKVGKFSIDEPVVGEKNFGFKKM
jgi:hypothetical protein